MWWSLYASDIRVAGKEQQKVMTIYGHRDDGTYFVVGEPPDMGPQPDEPPARAYTISSGGCYLPGGYDTVRTARYAYQFPNEVLYELSQRIYHVDAENRPITLEDLREARRAMKL